MKMSVAEVAEVPSVVVTVTSTVPATWAGDVAVIDVEPWTTTLVPWLPLPNVTVELRLKFVPVMVTCVVPVVVPDDGLSEVTVGTGESKVNRSALEVADVPADVVTVTSTLPDACAGAVAVIVEELPTVTLVPAVPPKLTVAPDTKFEPEMVTTVPPAVDPVLGLTAVTAGAGRVP